jgi:hypothetical protein
MADDVATPLNPPITPVENEKLEDAPLDEAPFDINVSQRLRVEKSTRRVVRTRVDYSAWDRRLSSNPHALIIHLEFVSTRGIAPKRFEECQCEDNDVCLHR